MADVTRRSALALAGAAGAGPAYVGKAAEAGLPASPVSAVLAKHPWISQPHYIESTALAGKLSEHLGWPPSAGRAVVRAAYEQMLGEPNDDVAFLANIDLRVAAVLASNEPLPRDRVDTPEAEARFAAIVDDIEQKLS